MNRLIRVLTSILVVEVGVIACLFGIKKLDEKLTDLENEAKKDAEELFKKNHGTTVDGNQEGSVQEPVKKESKLDNQAVNPKAEASEKKTEFKVKPIEEDVVNKVNSIKPETKKTVAKATPTPTPTPTVTADKKVEVKEPTKAKKPATKRATPAKKTVVKPTTAKTEKVVKPKTTKATKPEDKPGV